MLNQNDPLKKTQIKEYDPLWRMSFEIFDFDDDGTITELDLFAFFKIYEFED